MAIVCPDCPQDACCHFTPKSPDPFIKKDKDMELAKFGHLNHLVDMICCISNEVADIESSEITNVVDCDDEPVPIVDGVLTLPCVITDATLTGNGTTTSPLSVVGSGVSACPYESNPNYPGIPLGRAATFAILAGGAAGALTITTAAQPVTGDIGQFGAMTGTPIIISGNDYSSNSAQANYAAYATGAITDATALYTTLAALAGAAMPAVLTGVGTSGTITPGIYKQAGAMSTLAGTTVTLNGAGCYVFISSAGNIAPGANTTIVLTNGALASDVYWVTSGGMSGSGADNIWKGTVLTTGAITTGAHTTLEGRLISTAAAITVAATNATFIPLT